MELVPWVVRRLTRRMVVWCMVRWFGGSVGRWFGRLLFSEDEQLAPASLKNNKVPDPALLGYTLSWGGIRPARPPRNSQPDGNSASG